MICDICCDHNWPPPDVFVLQYLKELVDPNKKYEDIYHLRDYISYQHLVEFMLGSVYGKYDIYKSMQVKSIGCNWLVNST